MLSIMKEEWVSPACTLADMIIIFLFENLIDPFLNLFVTVIKYIGTPPTECVSTSYLYTI